jgi:leucyl/phenylalanyl-tRNA--protein transferase
VSSWPVEPPPTRWHLPHVGSLGDDLAGEDLVALGADLEPGTIIWAYRQGLFPMHVGPGPRGRKQLGWWSPDPRGVLPLDGLVISRSLRRSLRHYTVTVDTAFDHVVTACAQRDRPGAWITDEVHQAYLDLHHLGWAHSVETRTPDGDLAGGLYGVSIGGLFAGESMFHAAPDASKVALVHLVAGLAFDAAPRLLDVQWLTPHLQRLGAVEVPRAEYALRLATALGLPPPAMFCTRSAPVSDPG